MTDFDEFFAAHYERVVVSLRLAFGSSSDSEDAAQEAFAKAMLRWRSVSRMDRPSTWVYVVAVRELRRRARRHVHRFSASSQDGNDQRDIGTPDPADMVVTNAVLGAALGVLPARQRLAVALRFHGDLSVKEVARAMGCSEGTVKASLHAAMARLRVHLGDRDLDGANDGS
ncbi:MAG: putative polymerase ECF-subfamily sigma factor [Actinomycetia bacterium]|nr:putative polymerase ECF-subfamily sigma factor [Actinomycetes bacterium]